MKKMPAQRYLRTVKRRFSALGKLLANFYRPNMGFSLMEIIIVVTIIVFVGTFAALFFSRFVTQSNVTAVHDQLLATLRKAHTYSITSRKSATSGWGVHYEPGTRRITLFQGTSYAGRNTALDEISTVPNAISVTGFTDVIFQRITGYPTFVGTAIPTTAPTAVPTGTTPSDWYNASWAYRKRITVDGARVAGSTNLSNFPLLVSVTDPNLQTRAQSSGNDILFTASDGQTKLDHEIERYTSVNGNLIAWVVLPTLNATSNTDIYMYYGNPAAANQQFLSNSDASVKGVWHLKETSGQHLDTTPNNNDSTTVSVGTQGSAAGRIDGADDFTANTQRISIPDTASLEPGTGNFTLSTWVRFDSLSSTLGRDQKIVFKNHPSSPWVGYELLMDYPSNDLIFQWTNGTDYYSGGAPAPALGSWVNMVGVKNGTTTTLYINGIASTYWNSTGTTGGVFDTTGALTIGNSLGSENIDGIVDEVRLITTARSADWILTEYNNQSSPATFYTIGAETPYTTGGSGGPITTTTTFEPIADTFVWQDHPTTNYGTDQILYADSIDEEKISYIRFDLTSLANATINSAQLRMYVIDPTSASQSIQYVTGNWNEYTVTYNTRPTLGAQFATNNGGNSNVWKIIDVASAVTAEKGQLFDLALTTTSEYKFGVSSREAAANNPELIINYTLPASPTATPAPTPPPTGTVIITVSGNNGVSKQILINGVGGVSEGATFGPTVIPPTVTMVPPVPTATSVPPTPTRTPTPVPPTATTVPPTPTRTPTPVPPTATPLPPATPIALRGTASNNVRGASSLTINKPTGTQIGDLLIAHIALNQLGSTITITPPVGSGTWILLRSNEISGGLKSAIYYKFNESSDPSSFTFQFTAATNVAGGIAAYTNVNSTAINAHNGQVNSSASTSVSAPSVNTTVAYGRMLYFGATTIGNATLSAPSGMTSQFSNAAIDPSGVRITLADQALGGTAGATGTRSGTASVSTTSIGHSVVIRPQ